MSEVTNKNYHESTPFQRAGDNTLKFLAVAFLVATVLTCVVTSLKAHSLNGGPDTWEYRGWSYERISHPNGPNFGSYVATAVCTAVGVIPGLLFINYAFLTKRYHKELRQEAIAELRKPAFDKKRGLLFWNNGKWSEKRVASLEKAVRDGHLTPENVTYFDTDFRAMHLKMLEIEKHETTTGVKRGVLLDEYASPKTQRDHATLRRLCEELNKLNEKRKEYEPKAFHTGAELTTI